MARRSVRHSPNAPLDSSADAIFERRGGWRRWASDAEGLIHVLDTAAARVDDHSDEIALSLEVEFPQTGRGITRKDLAAFTRELRASFIRVGAIDCNFLGRNKDTEPHIAVNVSIDPETVSVRDAASLQVRGSDQTLVDGIFDQTYEKMVNSNHASPFIRRLPLAGMLTGILVLLGVITALFALSIGDPNPNDLDVDVPSAQVVGVLAALVVWILMLAFYRWVQVPVEFLEPGGQTRWHRSKRWVITVGVGLVLSAAGLVVALAR